MLRAVAEDVITTAEARTILECGKRIFYPDRTYAAIMRLAAESGLPSSPLNRMQSFSVDHAVDQKLQDALVLLGRIKSELEREPPSAEHGPRADPGFRFEYTESWHELRRRLEQASRT